MKSKSEAKPRHTMYIVYLSLKDYWCIHVYRQRRLGVKLTMYRFRHLIFTREGLMDVKFHSRALIRRKVAAEL